MNIFYRDPFIGQTVTWIDSLCETEDSHIHRMYKTGIIKNSTDYYVSVFQSEDSYPMHLPKWFLAERVEDYNLKQAILESIGAYSREIKNDPIEYYIYRFYDPRDAVTRYVGVSKQPLERFKQHLRGDTNYSKTAWIRELQALGLEPIMEIIEKVQGSRKARKQETHWIQYYRSCGAPLTNLEEIRA